MIVAEQHRPAPCASPCSPGEKGDLAFCPYGLHILKIKTTKFTRGVPVKNAFIMGPPMAFLGSRWNYSIPRSRSTTKAQQYLHVEKAAVGRPNVGHTAR
jgi:hypothetical protein